MQGVHSSYRLNKIDPNPLLAVRRPLSTHPPGPLEEKSAAEEAFGNDPLPQLRSITFSVSDTDYSVALHDGYFPPKVHSSSNSHQLQCKLKFSGSSVLEGVRESVRQDLVTLPVPSSLTGMTSAAKNVFSVNVT